MHGSQVRHSALCLAIALMSAAARLAAQDQPDFSGSWVLESTEPPTEDVPRALSVLQPVTRTNVRGEPIGPFFKDITITRVLEYGPQSETYQIGAAGGIVFGIVPGDSCSERPRPQFHHLVVWEGESLVFETGSHTGDKPGTGVWRLRRETWTLQPTGRLHVEIITRSSTEADKTVLLVYRRQ